jgi:GntR family transcriptional regulator
MQSLQKDLPIPLYHQLKTILLNSIESGEWKPEQRLPTESELAQRFGVSKITVRQAMRDLAEIGYVRREQGRGTFVAIPKLQQGPRELTSFTEEMRRHGLPPSSRVIEQRVVPASGEVAVMLRIPEGRPLVLLRRLRLAGGESMGVQTSHIPAYMAPGLEKDRLDDASLYDVLNSRYGLSAATARETHSAIILEPADAALLGVPPGSAALAGQRVTFLADGKPFEFVTSLMRGDRYHIVLELVKTRGARVSPSSGRGFA